MKALSLRNSADINQITNEEYSELIRFARYFALSYDMAQEAVQEGLRIGIEKRSTLRNPEKIWGWLCVIIRNEVFELKRKAIKSRSLLPLQENTLSQNEQDIIFTRLFMQELCIHTFNKFPKDYSRLFELRYDYGLSFVQIGKLLNMSPDTARNIHARVLKKMRSLYAQFYD